MENILENKIIILDIDETLIHSSLLIDKMGNEHDFMIDKYFVYKRPFVDEFLNYCFDNFKVGIWSSGTEDYVNCIVRNLFERSEELLFIWTREKCTLKTFESFRYSGFSNEPLMLKNLNKLKKKGYDLKNIIVIDDSTECHTKNYGNLINVSSFEGKTDDKELLHLMKYLDTIKNEPNIRKIEKRDWRCKLL